MTENNQKKLTPENFVTSCHPTWCPGCGDWGIWMAMRQALAELNIETHNVVISYGIGCAGNMANNIKCYAFHSLHGRALPPAVGVKLTNDKLTVLAIAGDGDAYDEGISHFIHTARYNIDLTYIVCDNRSFSLTTGQASPTSDKGYVSKTTPWGEVKEPINPSALALESGATFVARGFAGDPVQLKDIIKEAILHPGFSHINVLQQCVTFNKINTLKYFKEKIYKLKKDFDSSDKKQAWGKLQETEKLSTGIFYQVKKSTYEKSFPQTENESLLDKKMKVDLNKLLDEFK